MYAFAVALARVDDIPAVARSVVTAVAEVLESMGVPEVAGDPDEVFERAATLLSEPLIGIVVASRVPVGAYGVLEYGMRASATIGDALDRLARHYSSVSTRVRAEVGVVDGHSALVFIRRPGIQFSRHWIEMPAAAIAGRLREGVGNAQMLHEVHFTHAELDPALAPRYEEALGAPVRFGMQHDALLFAEGALTRVMHTGAEPIASSADAALRALGNPGAEFPDVIRVRLREEILARLATDVSLPAVARALKLAPRTLQRLLRSRGSSWSKELDAVRRERAVALLSDKNRKSLEVAMELGFREQSAFYRAFRRWFGTTPDKFRRDQ